MDQELDSSAGVSIVRSTDSSPLPAWETTRTPAHLQMDCPDTYPEQVDDSVMQISGTVYWFLEGWIGDHSVDFLIDSGSSVTAMSNSFYQRLIHAGAPLGALEHAARTLRGANGTGIGVSGCSHCVVSFMGFRSSFVI